MIWTALSPILGGITGLLGSWVEKRYELQKSKVDLDTLKENNRLAESLADKEYSRLVKIAEIDVEKLNVTADSDALQASYNVFTAPMTPAGTPLSGGKLWLALLIDSFNNLVRPFSTVYYQVLLGGLTMYTVYYLNTYAPGMLTTDEMKLQLLAILFSIIDMILFLASMSLGWWFGNRGMSVRGKR